MVKKSRCIIWGLILVVFLSPGLVYAQLLKSNDNTYRKDVPLLLNSGITNCQSSTVTYILWTDNESKLPVIYEIIKKSGYPWKKEVFKDFASNKVYKFQRKEKVTCEQEQMVVSELNSLEKQIKGQSIYLYFQQEINQSFDLESYLRLNQIKKIEKIVTEQYVSLTGYSHAISKTIEAGNSDINIQLLTKKTGGIEKTILALPALLDEF